MLMKKKKVYDYKHQTDSMTDSGAALVNVEVFPESGPVATKAMRPRRGHGWTRGLDGGGSFCGSGCCDG